MRDDIATVFERAANTLHQRFSEKIRNDDEIAVCGAMDWYNI